MVNHLGFLNFTFLRFFSVFVFLVTESKPISGHRFLNPVVAGVRGCWREPQFRSFRPGFVWKSASLKILQCPTVSGWSDFFPLKVACLVSPYGFVWKCCVPLHPMVLLIIIPMKNGYFIGGVPHFQTYPYIPIFQKAAMGKQPLKNTPRCCWCGRTSCASVKGQQWY